MPQTTKIVSAGDRWFSSYASHIWNSLPSALKDTEDISIFKPRLKTNPPKPGPQSQVPWWYCVCVSNIYGTLLNWPIVSLSILFFYFILFSNVFGFFKFMNILYALLVLRAAVLVSTNTCLYDLTVIHFTRSYD